MPNYALGKLYLVSNSINEMVYIGATTTSLYQRWSVHRSCARNGKGCPGLSKAMRELGEDKFVIGLIRDTPCDNALELSVFEFAEMAKYPASRLYNVYTNRDDLVNQGRALAARNVGVPLPPRTDQHKLKLSQAWLHMAPERKAKLRVIYTAHLRALSDRKRASSKVIEHTIGDVLVSWDERKRAYRIRLACNDVKSFSVITRGIRARTRDEALQLARDWANTYAAGLNKKNDTLVDQHVDSPLV